MGCQIGALRLLVVVPNIIFFAGACYLLYIGGSQLHTLDQELNQCMEQIASTGVYVPVNETNCPEGEKFGELVSTCDDDDKKCQEAYKIVTAMRYIFIFIIGVGALECITTFLGTCGALADKRKMLKLYAGILLFLILLQIAAAVLLFMYHENPENIPKEFKIDGATYQNVVLDVFGVGVTSLHTQGIVVIVSALVNIIMALGACFLSTKIHEG